MRGTTFRALTTERVSEPYGIVRKLFACKFKNVWYNVDIRVRVREKEKRE
jgi:hypothetical protein